jgi:hypothetical protein
MAYLPIMFWNPVSVTRSPAIKIFQLDCAIMGLAHFVTSFAIDDNGASSSPAPRTSRRETN